MPQRVPHGRRLSSPHHPSTTSPRHHVTQAPASLSPIGRSPYGTRNRSVTIWAMVRLQATIRVLVTLLGEAQDTLDKTIHNLIAQMQRATPVPGDPTSG